MAKRGKTHSGAKKRLHIRKNGRVKRKSANHNHILTKQSSKRKRRLASTKDAVAVVARLAKKLIKYV